VSVVRPKIVRTSSVIPDVDSPAFLAASGLVRLVHLPVVSSTMDVAHALAAEGTPAGTLILADRQEQGRGRAGKAWSSEEHAGIWCTLIERPLDAATLSVLSLRVGLALAAMLDPCVASPVRLKWPNDLFVGDGKLGGVLVEARWRGARIEWVGIGVGINRRLPSDHGAAGFLAASVHPTVSQEDLVARTARALRGACEHVGPLTTDECAAWHARDVAIGRQLIAPVVGTARGVAADGGLVVASENGILRTVHSGSLQFA